MKRLIKLLSIFGVLIILGSCSSSKSVNITNETNPNQVFVNFISEDSAYRVRSITIRNAATGATTTIFEGEEDTDGFIEKNKNYYVDWKWISKSDTTDKGECYNGSLYIDTQRTGVTIYLGKTKDEINY